MARDWEEAVAKQMGDVGAKNLPQIYKAPLVYIGLLEDDIDEVKLVAEVTAAEEEYYKKRRQIEIEINLAEKEYSDRVEAGKRKVWFG